MSNRDRKLIEQAEGVSCFVWFEIEPLIEQAESREAKEKIRLIMNKKYHEEEFYSEQI